MKIVNRLNEQHKGKYVICNSVCMTCVVCTCCCHYRDDVTFAVNKFADMTTEEFKSNILMPDMSKIKPGIHNPTEKR